MVLELELELELKLDQERRDCIARRYYKLVILALYIRQIATPRVEFRPCPRTILLLYGNAVRSTVLRSGR